METTLATAHIATLTIAAIVIVSVTAAATAATPATLSSSRLQTNAMGGWVTFMLYPINDLGSNPALPSESGDEINCPFLTSSVVYLEVI